MGYLNMCVRSTVIAVGDVEGRKVWSGERCRRDGNVGLREAMEAVRWASAVDGSLGYTRR